MNVIIKGFDKLQRDLEDAQRAFQSLDGTIATLRFNPNDPQSVQNTIREMETAIDSKTAAYRGNALVAKVAKAMKNKYREKILLRQFRTDPISYGGARICRARCG